MPAICTNVNRRNPLTPQPGGGFGQLVGGPITLHFDTDATRKDTRRNFACPGSWNKNHPCPETAPPQPHTVPKGSSLNRGSFPARPHGPSRQNKQRGDTGYNTIANAAGQPAGMVSQCSSAMCKAQKAYTLYTTWFPVPMEMYANILLQIWTCDEWPMATYGSQFRPWFQTLTI